MNNGMSLVVPLLACFVISILQWLINTKKKNRRTQLPLPIFATVFSVLGIVAVVLLNDDIVEFVNSLTPAPENVPPVDRIYTNENLIGSDIFIMNMIIAVLFVVVRLFVLFVCRISAKKKYDEDSMLAKFYYFDSYNDYWFLKDEWANVREIFKVLSVVSTFVVGVLLAVTWYVGYESPMWVYAYPVVVMLVITEISNFLNGITQQEYLNLISGEESTSVRVLNFHKIRDIYENLFKPELLAANSSLEFKRMQATTDYLKELEKSEDSIENIVAKFFSSNGGNYKTDEIAATVKLVKKENVVFLNPFYRDAGKYLILPLINALLSSGKCLVVVGRTSVQDDVKLWLQELIKSYVRMESLWRVDALTKNEPDCEIGIINSAQLYDINVIKANNEFFGDTKLVLLIEPSLISGTGQISLGVISRQIESNGNNANYCIIDRQADGLVDTMSHILRSEITAVVAPPMPSGSYTGMIWNADGDYLKESLLDRQTQFFGNGIELASVAIKNQVGRVNWYSETKAPVKDIKWIAGQHFPTLCKYMNIPIQQKSLDDKILFFSNLWSAVEEDEQFIITNDEFYNMFIMLRAFLSRGKGQTFVNVFSENYLLRDYMRCNRELFLSNPSAIPSVVSEYSNSQRNTLFKLIFMMAEREVSEREIDQELDIINYKRSNALSALSELLKLYTDTDETVINITLGENDNYKAKETFFSISKQNFNEYFSNSLRNAYYIVENEKKELEYIDSRLYGHITQLVMPGQYLTHDGKYYQVMRVSSNSGVILHRASKNYSSNRYYKQIRKYHIIPNDNAVDYIVSSKKISDIEFTVYNADIDVDTNGYVSLNQNNDYRTAKIVDLSNDPQIENFNRHYKHKEVLKISLPESTPNMRFTVTLLLSELFKTIFPNSWQYIAVLSAIPEDIEGMLNYANYTMDKDLDDEYIYIVEDSDMDLGLIGAIINNFEKILYVLTDFLEWHFEKMREPESKDPVLKKKTKIQLQSEHRQSRFSQMMSRIRNLFGTKSEETFDIGDIDKIENNVKPTEEEKTESSEKAENEEIKKSENDAFDENDVDEPKKDSEDEIEHVNDEAEIAHVDGTDIFEETTDIETEDYFEERFKAMGLEIKQNSRYQKECFLKFGFEEIDKRLELDYVRKYFTARGYRNNYLTKARVAEKSKKTFIDFSAENTCDFCGMPLSGISYERLDDGRIRCNDCSQTAITTVEEFKELFIQILAHMQELYGIEYKKQIIVKTADAKTIAKGFGSIYQPSTQFAARVLGYASLQNGTYSLNIENGSPRLATIDTMVHELTHIWQYINWKDNEVRAAYGDGALRDAIYEGMAMWSAIQYLYAIGEKNYAQQSELLAEAREDIYGIGFRAFREAYPLVKDSSIIKHSPFNEFPPIQLM